MIMCVRHNGLFIHGFVPQQHWTEYQAMLPHIASRSSQLNQEFAFLPTAPPRELGGIFELRTYQLKAGTLLEWETTWQVHFCSKPCKFLKAFSTSFRRKGIIARKKFVEPVGAWFSQVGRLHQVHHMWQYPSAFSSYSS
jgi:hypothetical protein